MADALFSPKVSPLVIRDQGNKNGEYFDLDSLYLLTLERFEHSTQELQHAMAAPGFFIARSGVVQKEYHPDNRPLHQHGCLELMYVINGEVTQYVEDHVRVYGPGACCILNKNTRHVEAYASDFEVCFLLLSDRFVREAIEQDLQFADFRNGKEVSAVAYRELRRFLNESGAFQKEYLEFVPATDSQTVRDTVEELFVQILKETQCQAPGFLSIVRGNFTRLLGMLSDSGKYALRCVDMKGTREDYLVNSVRRYLNANHGRVNYRELEEMMHYTGDYLSRIVRRKCGMSLVELGRSIALEEAAVFLQETDHSVSEIMQILGYSNRTYFYRIFREKYGVTPKEFRNQTVT